MKVAPTRNSLLGYDEIRLEFNDLIDHSLNLLLLNLLNSRPVRLLRDLDVRLGLSLLVLDRKSVV